MYWSRTGSIFEILLWLLMGGLWSLGGWLIVAQAFQLRSRERLMAGFAVGLLSFITLANLLAHILPLTVAFWTAAAMVFGLGVVLLLASWRSGWAWSPLEDLKSSWRQVLALFLLTVVFEMIGRGLALFDDYLHMPLVSVMAAGEIPPRFYLDPSKPMSYHYGLQVLAASLARLGGLFPWSAWDLSKALAIALTLLLGYLWVRRLLHNTRAASLGSFLFAFAGGARWLLLLVPTGLLVWMSNSVQLSNSAIVTAPDLISALARPWVIEGGGPFPFPFAFHNGIFIPVIFMLGSSGAMPFFTTLLLLLLADRHRFSMASVAIFSLIFASLALSAEHLFVFLWVGIALAGSAAILIKRRSQAPVSNQLWLPWGAILAISGVLSAFQGGYLTEAAHNLLLRLQGAQIPQGPYDYFYFNLRLPPGLNSAHLGDLSLLNLPQFFVLLAELGPALLLIPTALWYAWRGLRRQDWLLAGLGACSALSIVIPTFFSYGFERSATRLPATALWIWVLLAFPPLWARYRKAHQAGRFWLGLGYGSLVFGGAVIFAVQMTAIPAPQLTYFANSTDAKMSSALWNRLPPGALVFDKYPWRAVTLFGQPTVAYEDVYQALPQWTDLAEHPDPLKIAAAGYDFFYLDFHWWDNMTPEQRTAFRQPCVRTFAEVKPADGDFRRLLDLRACRNQDRLFH
jgi:hypothetical protein